MPTSVTAPTYGPDTPGGQRAQLDELRARGLISRVGFQITDVTGPEHARTYVCSARCTTAAGDVLEVTAAGTGSKAAKRGAAVELLRILTEA